MSDQHNDGAPNHSGDKNVENGSGNLIVGDLSYDVCVAFFDITLLYF
jgi:hypothetical protein